MARSGGIYNQFNPIKGFVTEFTPTRFPADAAIDINNCIIDVDGSIRRRPGLNFETSYTLNKILSTAWGDAEIEELAVNTYLWESVNNSGLLNVVVVQVGLTLQFYEQVGNISNNLLYEVFLFPYTINLSEAKKDPVSFTSGCGNLYVVGKHIVPIQITYVEVTDGVKFASSQILMYERDFIGLDDGLSTDERPTTLTPEHFYNLLNQGWTVENLVIFSGASGNICEKLYLEGEVEAAADKNWPSNADIMYLGFSVDDEGNPIFDRDELVKAHWLGSTPAPKGRFIIDIFTQNRNKAIRGIKPFPVSTGINLEDCPEFSLFCVGVATGILDVTPSVSVSAATCEYDLLSIDTSIESLVRPEAVAFHNGKLFYARNEQVGLTAGVYYSRTLTTAKYVGQCHPEADPTAEDINELLATDGGFVAMPGVGQILVLSEFHNGVLLGASNGVWFLTGADVDVGFTATSNRLVKISSTGLLSASSFVDAGQQAFYFSLEGIMVISLGQVGLPEIINMSENTIQQYYFSRDKATLKNAVGIHIAEQRKVYWGFIDDESHKSIDTLLVLDMNIGGFYKHSIAVDDENRYPRVLGFTHIPPLANKTIEETLTTTNKEAITLVDGSTLVTSSRTITISQVPQLKLLTVVDSATEAGWLVTFSEFNNRTFNDWLYHPLGGTSYLSYVDFGYNYLGAIHTRGTATYVHSFFAKDSKNLESGNYYELPPLPLTEGFRATQSVLEVLYLPDMKLRPTQSVLEVLYIGEIELKVTQSVLEILHEIA